MTNALTKAWTEVVRPLFLRPKRVQVAALCLRDGETGQEVLLITSRDTGRWIVPKGWPIDGKDGAETALQEAWEEAGVEDAVVCNEPMGQYDYDKWLNCGTPQPVETNLYRLKVTGISDDYPEAHQRKRLWVSPAEAANLVDEPQLKAILRDL